MNKNIIKNKNRMIFFFWYKEKYIINTKINIM